MKIQGVQRNSLICNRLMARCKSLNGVFDGDSTNRWPHPEEVLQGRAGLISLLADMTNKGMIAIQVECQDARVMLCTIALYLFEKLTCVSCTK